MRGDAAGHQHTVEDGEQDYGGARRDRAGGERPAALLHRMAAVTLDTDTTVQTLFGHQMGGRKSYNPKNRGKKSYQRMSSEGWCIQWELTPPGQKSKSCSLDSQEEGN